jgi:hypothetical protein
MDAHLPLEIQQAVPKPAKAAWPSLYHLLCKVGHRTDASPSL